MTALPIVLALGFVSSMGAHYTGAVMGMPIVRGWLVGPGAALALGWVLGLAVR